MGGFSLPHILIFAVVAILLLGGGRFSSMMGDVAKGVKQFKRGMSEDDDTTTGTKPPSSVTVMPSKIEGPQVEGRTAAEIIAEHERTKAAQAQRDTAA